MKKIILGLVFFCISKISFSAYIVDLYGAEKKEADQILQKYSNQVIEIESALTKELENFFRNGEEDIKKINEIEARKKKLEENIKKDGMFLHVHSQITIYPFKKDKYITIDVITKNNPERLAFIAPEKKHKKYVKHRDLIEKMREYDLLSYQLNESQQLNAINISCPVHHCTFGFDHPKLKPYLKIFNEGVIQEKTKILKVLKQDPDPERRAAAAFLVGHFENSKEIISILSQHIGDKNASVRNNVLRVIGYTLETSHINNINIAPFLSLLKSPYGTDRNKTLALLANANLDKTSIALLTDKGQDDLLKILQLKQPNNHDWAYLLLKKISGKNYREYDIAAWERWFSMVKKKKSI